MFQFVEFLNRGMDMQVASALGLVFAIAGGVALVWAAMRLFGHWLLDSHSFVRALAGMVMTFAMGAFGIVVGMAFGLFIGTALTYQGLGELIAVAAAAAVVWHVTRPSRC